MKERIFIQKAKDQIRLEEFLHKAFSDAKCGDIEIQYTPIGTRIIIYTVTPGLVIGSGGDKIREVSIQLKEKFGIENPQIDVQKISNPDMDPKIVAQSIAASLESGVSVKRLGNFYLERIMRSGALGCEIVIAGKLSGDRARTERFVAGYLKKCGETAVQDVIKGFAVALPQAGNIGITVKIMIRHSDKKISIIKPASTVEGTNPELSERKEEITA